MTRTDLALYVAVAAAVAAALLLFVVIYQALLLRRIRRDQRLIVSGDTHDLVEYAVGLLARVERVEQRADAVERSVARATARVDGCYQRRSLLRYDALEGSGGKQSATIAVMDAGGSGIVLSAIQGRDYARIYIKDVQRGESDVELSPEEQRAIDAATG
ncbi:MAG TPA: DUF4446 family protein [Gaiellales bacterium]|nr:DUF4446 family protein [Gaiellales bacterium]